MNALRNWLIANNYATTAPAEIISVLDAPMRTRRPESEATYSIAGIADRLQDPAVGETIRGAMIALGMEGQAMRFCTVGLDFGNPMLDGLLQRHGAANEVIAPHLAELEQIGFDTRAKWQRDGLTFLPTVEEIQTVQATIATEELREQVATRYQSVRDAIDAGEILTWEEARTAMGAADSVEVRR